MAEGDPVDHLGGAHQAHSEQVTRQDLYAQVWKAPMLRVAERHGVSSSFLARVCAVMNIPRPARGHWAKLEFGKAGARLHLCPRLVRATSWSGTAAEKRTSSRLRR